MIAHLPELNSSFFPLQKEFSYARSFLSQKRGPFCRMLGTYLAIAVSKIQDHNILGPRIASLGRQTIHYAASLYPRNTDPMPSPRRFLIHLSTLSPENAAARILPKTLAPAIPSPNPLRFGYADKTEYESDLGRYAIAAQAALTALGMLALTLGKTIVCIANRFKDPGGLKNNGGICSKKIAYFWQQPSGKTFLIGAALLLYASFYLHKKGKLGALFYDPFLSFRSRKIQTLFENAAKELGRIKKASPATAKEMASRILSRSVLIEATLHFELQLPKETAKNYTRLLSSACKQALRQSVQTEESL